MKAVLFDISGVLLDGPTAIPGATEAVSQVLQAGIAIRLVTNTSRQTREQVAGSLKNAGFQLGEELIYTAPLAARDYARLNNLNPWCLVHKNLLPDMDHVAPDQANAVIIGDAENDFNYENLNQAFRLCLEGAPLIAIGANKYFRMQGKFYLDAGPFVRAIEFASGQPPVITGKPSSGFYQQVLEELQLPAHEVMMIGDDVESDVNGALESGLNATLVQTGKYLPGDENKARKCCELAEDVGDAIKRLLGQT